MIKTASFLLAPFLGMSPTWRTISMIMVTVGYARFGPGDVGVAVGIIVGWCGCMLSNWAVDRSHQDCGPFSPHPRRQQPARAPTMHQDDGSVQAIQPSVPWERS